MSISSSELLDRLTNELPHPLAVVLREYLYETNDYNKLWRLVGAAELLVRFLASVALGEVFAQPHAALPKKLETAILEGIERPTFGVWIRILIEATQALPRAEQLLVPELPRHVELVLAAISPPESNFTNSILSVRNVLGHEFRLSQRQIQAAMKEHGHEQRFESLWLDPASAFLSELALVGLTDNSSGLLLKGIPSKPGAYAALDLSQFEPPIAAALPPGAIVLSRSGSRRWISLFPLQAIGPIMQRTDQGLKPTIVEPIAQVYARRDAPLLHYVALDDRLGQGDGTAAMQAAFDQLFPLQHWRDREEEAEEQDAAKIALSAAASEYSFREVIKEVSEPFVGRDEALHDVLAWLAAQSSGAGLLLGSPGSGKTAFVAKLSTTISKQHKRWLCVRYFFAVGDARCSTRAFMKGVLLQLQLHALNAQIAARKQGKPPDQHSAARDAFPEVCKTFHDKFLGPAPLRDQQAVAQQAFVDVLEHFAAAFLGPASSHDRVILLADGLDEIAQVEPQFFDLVRGRAVDGVVWLVSGRPDIIVLTNLPEDSVSRLLAGDGSSHAVGLGPLDARAVRQLLVEGVDWRKYQLFAVEDEAGHNPFVERLVERVGGLPLYLRLLVEDLRKGNYKYDRPDELPATLEAYYDRLLERLTLDAARKVLPDVVALLAIAKCPLTDEMLSTLLSDHDLRADRDWELLFQQTLRLGHTLMRDGFLWEETIGHTLYHASFRTHLLHGEEKSYDEFPMGPVLRKARGRVLKLCERWAELPTASDARRYAITYAALHFLEANDLAAVDRLTQSDYFETQADELGTVEALLSAHEVATTLALHGEDYFPAVKRAALAYCQLSEELRGAPESFPNLIRRGEVSRVRSILASDPDPLRQACLRLAVAPLLAEQGHGQDAEELWSESTAYLRQLRPGAWKESATVSAATEPLVQALLAQTSFVGPVGKPDHPPPLATEVEEGSPATTTIPWWWRVLGVLNGEALMYFFMLGVFTGALQFFLTVFASVFITIHESDFSSYSDNWLGKAVLYAQLGLLGGSFALVWLSFVYTPLLKWHLDRCMDDFLDAYEQGLARQTSQSRRRQEVMKLLRFLNTADIDLAKRPWQWRLGSFVVREWSTFADDANEAALFLIQCTALGERGNSGLIPELRRLSPARRAKLHPALGSLPPFGLVGSTWFEWIDRIAQRFVMFKNESLLRFAIATAEPRSSTEGVLAFLAINEPLVKPGDKGWSSELALLPSVYLGRALLSSLSSTAMPSWSAFFMRPLRWAWRTILSIANPDFTVVLSHYRWEFLLLALWIIPVILAASPILLMFALMLALYGLAMGTMLGSAVLVGRIRRQVAIPEELLGDFALSWRCWLADAAFASKLEFLDWLRMLDYRRIETMLLAQQAYREGFTEALARHPVLAQRILRQLAVSGLFLSRAILVTSLMGDRGLLEGALSGPPTPVPQDPPKLDDVAELRRLLPLRSTTQSMLVMLVLSALGVSLWFAAIWMWVPAVRLWLAQYGFWELSLLALALVVLQHLPPLGRLLHRKPASGLPPAIEAMTHFSGWRIFVLVPLIVWIHTRTFALEMPLQSLDDGERTAADWLTIVIPASVIVITNLFVPELMARWRGLGLYYPTRRQYLRHRLKWCIVFVIGCIALAMLASMLGPSA